MREGMVLEVYRDYVAVMTKGGEYLKLRKNGNVEIGDIYKGRPYYKLPYYYVAAALMLIIITSYSGITAYANQIVGYVDINGAKSVRLYVNRKGTVQKVDGLSHPEAVKNLTVENAAQEINKIGSNEGIFTDSSQVEVTTKELKSSGINFSKEKDKLEKVLKKNGKDNKGQDKKDDESNDQKGNKKDNKKDKEDTRSINKSSEDDTFVNPVDKVNSKGNGHGKYKNKSK